MENIFEFKTSKSFGFFGLDVDEKFLYIHPLRKNNNDNYAFKIH